MEKTTALVAYTVMKPGWLANLVVGLSLGFGVFSLFRPMVGLNQWRDGQTFGVARNFIEERFDLLRPAFDLRGVGSGVLPTEFPLYPALVASAMSVFGTKLFLARFVSFLLFLGMLWTGGRLLREALKGDPVLFWLVGSTNTVLATQGTAIMPEVLLNALCALAAWAAWRSHAWAIVVVLLAALVKPQGACVGGFVAVLWWARGRRNLALAAVVVPVVGVFVWQRWTLQFSQNLYGGLPVTHHYHRNLTLIFREFSFENAFHALKKTVIHGLGVVGISAGIWGFARGGYRVTLFTKALGAWIALDFLFLLLAGSVQAHQTYYASAVALPLVFLICDLLRSGPPRRWAWVALVLQFGAVSVYWGRNVLGDVSQWGQIRAISQEVDQFSSRKDLFLVWGSRGYFPPLNLLGRRGLVLNDSLEIRREWNHFQFFYLPKESLKEGVEVLPEITVSAPRTLSDGSRVFRIGDAS